MFQYLYYFSIDVCHKNNIYYFSCRFIIFVKNFAIDRIQLLQLNRFYKPLADMLQTGTPLSGWGVRPWGTLVAICYMLISIASP